MTKKQVKLTNDYVQKFNELIQMYHDDKEALHIYADELLKEYLQDMDLYDVLNAYCKCEDIGFWYS